jgi:hypothetical protein
MNIDMIIFVAKVNKNNQSLIKKGVAASRAFEHKQFLNKLWRNCILSLPVKPSKTEKRSLTAIVESGSFEKVIETPENK